jgi:hypothetical protein
MPRRNDISKILILGWGPILLSVLMSVAVSSQTVMTTPLPVSECPTEVVTANLVLIHSTHVVGTLRDQTTAPFNQSKIVLRRYERASKVVDFKTVTTDEAGNFDLGTLSSGRYRLLAAPHRGFAQPEKLDCGRERECKLEITLETNPSDLAYAACPIK